MPQLIPVVAYYATAALTASAVLAQAAFFVASLVVGQYQRRKQERAARDAYNASLSDRTVIVRSAVSPKALGYGECVIGGTLVYALSSGANKEKLTLVIALQVGHEITAIDEIYFNDEPLGALDGNGNVIAGRYAPTRNDNYGQGFFSSLAQIAQNIVLAQLPVGGTPTAFTNTPGDGWQQLNVTNVSGSTVTVDTSGVPFGTQFYVDYRYGATTSYVNVRKYLGTASQTADAALVAASGGEWTTDHRGRGQPYVVITLDFDENIFPTGVPQMKFRCRLAKVYDPRNGLTAYSNNPALAVRDYLTSPLGFGCSASEIDDSLLTAAANVCDELVTINGDGVQQQRYRTNGTVSTEANRLDNLAMLCQAMAGFAVWSQGKWRVYAGAYRSPSLTLTEDDLTDRETFTIQSRAARRDLFNAVRGTFVDPSQNWQPVDFPPVTNSTYETQDGGERIYDDIVLPLETNAFRAQRLAKLRLEQARQAMAVQGSWTLKAYRVTPGDTVALNMPRYGFSNKVFRVLEREFSITDGIRLTLQEEAAAVYDWNFGQATEVDPAPNSTLPTPWNVSPLSGLQVASGDTHFLRLADGTLIARIFVTWTAPADAGVTVGGVVELQFKSNPDDQWRSLPPMPGATTSTYISPAEEGLFYQVRVRARNALGVASAWTYSEHHYVATKAAVPGNVASLTVTELGPKTRRLAWTMTTVPGDLAGFEIRVQSGATFNWGSASFFASVAAVAQGPGNWSYETTLPAAGFWSFGIRARDTSGNLSAAATTALNVSLGNPGEVRPPLGWGESICPDPYFQDVAWWTSQQYDQPGWYFENSDGVGNAPFVLGVGRSATLWSGNFTGSNNVVAATDLIPYSSVGQVLRLRVRGWNASNFDVGAVARFHNSAGFVIQDFGIFWSIGTGPSTKEIQLTVPSGTAFLSFYVGGFSLGNPYSGVAAISEVKLDHASGTNDVIQGAIIDTLTTTLANGYRFGKFASIIDESTFWSQVDATLTYNAPVDCIAEVEAFGNLFIESPAAGTNSSDLGVLIKTAAESVAAPIDPSLYATVVPSVDSGGNVTSAIYIRRRFNLTAGSSTTFELRGKRRPNLPSERFNAANGLRFRLTAYKR